MSYSNGLVTAPVSIYDVQHAIGNSSPDLGTLCQGNTINKWARYRPIEYKTDGNAVWFKPITEEMRAARNYGIGDIPVWKNGKTIGHMVNYWLGLNTSQTNWPTGYTTQDPPPPAFWSRVLPTSSFRLTDFVCESDPTEKGYYTSAEPPIGMLDWIGTENSGKVTAQYKMGLSGVTAGLTITYSDLGTMRTNDFQNLYFGVVIVAGNDIYLATQDNKVGTIDGAGITLWSMGATVRFKIDQTSGTISTYALNSMPVKIFPVLTSVKSYYENNVITPIAGTTTGTFVALEDYEQAIISIVYTQGIIGNLYAWKNTNQSTRLIYYSFTLRCTENSVIHYFTTNIYVKDVNGNVIGTQTILNDAINANGVVLYENSVDVGQYYSGAITFDIETEPGTYDTSAYKRPTSATTQILPTEPIIP